jgi:hypothetical protein
MSSRAVCLNIISPDAEGFLVGAEGRCAGRHRAGSLGDLRAVLEQQFDAPVVPRTLDLIGHSTRDHHLLRLGEDRIDMLDPVVARFFRALAAEQVLTRLGVVAVRLLGCETAVSPTGQRTLRLLAHTLRRPVFGASKTLLKSHYDAHGFDPAFAHVLIEASELV